LHLIRKVILVSSSIIAFTFETPRSSSRLYKADILIRPGIRFGRGGSGDDVEMDEEEEEEEEESL